jgi:hypothetical protein
VKIKNLGVKKVKNAVKVGVKKIKSAREKKTKSGPKRLSRPLLVFTPKKKKTLLLH